MHSFIVTPSTPNPFTSLAQNAINALSDANTKKVAELTAKDNLRCEIQQYLRLKGDSGTSGRELAKQIMVEHIWPSTRTQEMLLKLGGTSPCGKAFVKIMKRELIDFAKSSASEGQEFLDYFRVLNPTWCFLREKYWPTGLPPPNE